MAISAVKTARVSIKARPCAVSVEASTSQVAANLPFPKKRVSVSSRDKRDETVLEYMYLVKAIAIRVHEHLPVHVDLDDLIQEGMTGLLEAVNRFDPNRGVAFSSYAKHRIKGAILDSLRELDWASRDMRRYHKKIEAATRELAAILQRNPSESEVAEKLGMNAKHWGEVMIDLRNVGLISASTRSKESDDLPAPDFPCPPSFHPDSIYSNEHLISLLKMAIEKLPERYRLAVSLYYWEEMTEKEVGRVMNVEECRISQILISSRNKLRAFLGAIGITDGLFLA